MTGYFSRPPPNIANKNGLKDYTDFKPESSRPGDLERMPWGMAQLTINPYYTR